MIEGITGIWVFKEAGELIFSHEFYVQGSQDYDAALFQGLIVTIQQFVKELGEKVTDRIELGTSKIFISLDEETRLYFAIRSLPNVKDKKIQKTLAKLLEFFNLEIKPYLSKFSVEQLKIYISNVFSKYLANIIGTPLRNNLTNFFDLV